MMTLFAELLPFYNLFVDHRTKLRYQLTFPLYQLSLYFVVDYQTNLKIKRILL